MVNRYFNVFLNFKSGCFLLSDGKLDKFSLLVLLRPHLAIRLHQLSRSMAVPSHIRTRKDVSIMVGELPLPLLHPLLPCSTILFILLLPSVSPLSMPESSLPLAVIGVTVGKSVFARTLLQVGRILSLIFAPCGLAQVLALALS